MLCHMLGKTHEVTAPTGLLKVMESAVADRESLARLDRAVAVGCCCARMYAHDSAAHPKARQHRTPRSSSLLVPG